MPISEVTVSAESSITLLLSVALNACGPRLLHQVRLSAGLPIPVQKAKRDNNMPDNVLVQTGSGYSVPLPQQFDGQKLFATIESDDEMATF